MKLFLTTIMLLSSLITSAQSTVKPKTYTNVIESDTCLRVVTNDTTSIRVLKNTYRLNSYDVKDGTYVFVFPIKSSARVVTNLNGSKVLYETNKVIK